MSRTITITLEDAAYERLQEQFGQQPVVEVIQNLLRPYTRTKDELDSEYAAMAADGEREAEAMEWIEAAPDDGLGEEAENWPWFKQS